MKKLFSKKKLTALILVIICLSIPLTSMAHTLGCYLYMESQMPWDPPIYQVTATRLLSSSTTSTSHTLVYEDTYSCFICGDFAYTKQRTESGSHHFKSYHTVITPHLTYYYDRCDECGYTKNGHTVYK